jgi:hypothetical protein
MTLEAWNTAAAVGTFVVILASAVAALVQLRHLRTSNQLSGLIDERTNLQTVWYNVDPYWALLADSVAFGRTNRPHIFENFEYLAARARAWIAEHPDGDYPGAETRLLPARGKP